MRLLKLLDMFRVFFKIRLLSSLVLKVESKARRSSKRRGFSRNKSWKCRDYCSVSWSRKCQEHCSLIRLLRMLTNIDTICN